MGCFAFKSGGKSSGGSKAKQHPRPGAQTPPVKSIPASSSSSSSGGVHSKTKASAASTPTRTIQELSEERGAQRLRVFDLDELGSATNGFSRALKLGEGGFGSVYRAFFRSASAACPPTAAASTTASEASTPSTAASSTGEAGSALEVHGRAEQQRQRQSA